MKITLFIIILSVAQFTFATELYWTQLNEIRKADVQQEFKADEKNYPIVKGQNPLGGLQIDFNDKKIYFTDTGELKKVNMDGSEVATVVTGSGVSIAGGALALDLANGKIYWSNEGKIQRANLDGSDVEQVVETGVYPAEFIALDAGEAKIYWGSRLDSKIMRSNLDGSNKEEYITNLDLVQTLFFSQSDRKLYIGQGVLDNSSKTTVRGMRLLVVDVAKDNTTKNVFELKTDTSKKPIELRNFPISIYVDDIDRIVYWSQRGDNAIYRTFLDGLNTETAVPRNINATPNMPPANIQVLH